MISSIPSIVLAIRVRDEWELAYGLIESLSGLIQEVWILDDASSQQPSTKRLANLVPAVTILRAREWSRLSREGAQRDYLIQEIKRHSSCRWILQLDADERLNEPQSLHNLLDEPSIDGWTLPLIDFYITPEDKDLVNLAHPERIRSWFGEETRWTLCLFRRKPDLFVPDGASREPEGFGRNRVHRAKAPIVEHFGKATSVAEWERKAHFYIDNYPEWREKWKARLGRAVHHGVSDFDTPLLQRSSIDYSPLQAPVIYEYHPDTGMGVRIERLKRWLLSDFMRHDDLADVFFSTGVDSRH